MFRDILRSHPRLSFPPESHFIPGFYRVFGDPGSAREARRLTSILLRLSWVKRWNLDLNTTSLAHCRSYRELVAGMFHAWARREDKARWGDKTPQYVLEIATLKEIFPNGKIIHCYRDGRDVALSMLRAPFGPENIYTAARDWRRMVAAGRTAGRELPAEDYLEVRYESLLRDTVSTMRKVCAFLGESKLIGDIRPNFLPRTTRLAILGERDHSVISNVRVVAENAGKWKRQMSPPDRALFETVAGDLLQALGYETEMEDRPISRWHRAAWSVHNAARSTAKIVNSKDLPGMLGNALLYRQAQFHGLGKFLKSLHRPPR